MEPLKGDILLTEGEVAKTKLTWLVHRGRCTVGQRDICSDLRHGTADAAGGPEELNAAELLPKTAEYQVSPHHVAFSLISFQTLFIPDPSKTQPFPLKLHLFRKRFQTTTIS